MKYDSFFISNGEPLESVHYELAKNTFQDLKWIQGINSRDLAIKTAAENSTTEYFYCVPAKLNLSEKYLINDPVNSLDHKHYVFYCRNVLNDLVYGHQGLICYNKKLVLETLSWDLDFTMAQPFQSIFKVVGTAVFNQSEFITWRTAFREVIKLLNQQSIYPLDNRNNNRLNTWLTYTNGAKFSEWCLRGANDGKNYFNFVNGEMSMLKKSFSWDWLYEHSESLGYNFNR